MKKGAGVNPNPYGNPGPGRYEAGQITVLILDGNSINVAHA